MSDGLLARTEYRILGEFRCDLRRFLSPAEGEARRVGLPPQQHQAVLVMAGRDGSDTISVGELAECLSLKAHTVTELVNRMVSRRLVARSELGGDRRRTILALTPEAEAVLSRLIRHHRNELESIEPLASHVLARLRGGESV